jgi:hypothetical protein
MRKNLRIVALLLVVAAGGYWLAAGANLGWNKNKVEKKTLDPVTGIEGITYEKHFVPGAEFLGETGLGAIVLAGASFLFRNKQIATSNQT